MERILDDVSFSFLMNFIPWLGILFQFDNHKADWSKNTREVPLLRAMSLDHWLIVYTKGNYETALTLQQNLQKVTPKMGITVRNAKL